MNPDDGRIKMLLKAREGLYAYVSRAFVEEPDCNLVDFVCDDSISVLVSVLGERASVLQHRIAHAACGDADVLKNEFTRLFLGPAKLPVSPWESVYRAKNRLVFTEETLAVREAYRAAGLLSRTYRSEPDDHIAIELSFLSLLANETARCYEEGDLIETARLLNLQREFLRGHAIFLTEKISNGLACLNDISDFYPALSCLAFHLCAVDLDMIDELLT